jgi:hypothetical protein
MKIAKQQPNINYVGEGDIFSLNSLPDIDYSVFFVTQTNHSLGEDTITYNLVLYYIDRLLQDKSNELEVQSSAILMLNNIINIFNQLNPDAQINYDVDFNTFTHKFTDFCAGVFCNISITIDNEVGVCGY